MNRTPTYYQLLDVSHTATAAQIRTAYLRLVKRYHPDVAEPRPETADLLPRINEVYRALSDPVRRAAYDAELASAGQPQRSLPVPANAMPAPPLRAFRPQRRRWTTGLAAVFGCGVAVAVAQIANAWVEPDQSYARAMSWLGAAPTGQRLIALPFPRADAISRYARLGASLNPDGAEEQSRRCFARARYFGDRSAAQLCVVLDDAFLYTKGASSALTLYFDDVVVDLRHSAALDTGPRDTLLYRLRQASFTALMNEIRRPLPFVSQKEDAPSPPAAAIISRASRPEQLTDLAQSGTGSRDEKPIN